MSFTATMKNQKTSNKPTGLKKKIAIEKDRKAKLAGEHLKESKNDELIVLRDPYSKKDYYMSRIDSFTLMKTEYVVMYNYVPDDGSHSKPELVIMRTAIGENGDRVYYSIKDGEELEKAFVFFMRRYYGAQAPEARAKNGVSSGDQK